MPRTILIFASLLLAAAAAPAQQLAQWGGDPKAKAPAKDATGQTKAPPPPPPPSSQQSSTGAPPSPPPPLPGNATQSGAVTYLAYAEIESNGTVKHVTGGDGRSLPTALMGRNIRSIVHEATGTYKVTLHGSPAFPVCVATATNPDPRYSCGARVFPSGIGVSCMGPIPGTTGLQLSDMGFVIQCMAP